VIRPLKKVEICHVLEMWTGLKEQTDTQLSPPHGKFPAGESPFPILPFPLFGEDPAAGRQKTTAELVMHLLDYRPECLFAHPTLYMGTEKEAQEGHRTTERPATAAGPPHAMTKPGPELKCCPIIETTAKCPVHHNGDRLRTAKAVSVVTVVDTGHCLGYQFLYLFIHLLSLFLKCPHSITGQPLFRSWGA
jgi:hypothetical protein